MLEDKSHMLRNSLVTNMIHHNFKTDQQDHSIIL